MKFGDLFFAVGFATSVLFSAQQSYGQGAQGTATGEQATDYTMGGVSAGTGGGLMYHFCPLAHVPPPAPPNVMAQMMCYAVGPQLILSGANDIMQGAARSSDINPLTGNTNAPPPCDPTSGLCFEAPPPPGGPTGGGTTGGTPTVVTNPYNTLNPTNPGSLTTFTGNIPANVPPAVASTLKQAVQTAQQYGINPLDPTTAQQQAAQNSAAGGSSGGGGDGGSGSSGAGMGNLTPAMKKEIEKAKNEFLSKINIEDFGGEGGGRSLAANSGKQAADFDINSLLEKMNPKNAAREPGSIEGLQKNFNGEPIGVAADNIFKQVSRRYQKKIQARTFITSVKAK